MRIPRTLVSAAALAAALVLATAAAGPAAADPSTVPPLQSITGFAAPDLQYLCDQLSTDYNATSPVFPFYCFDPFPERGAGDPVLTKNNQVCDITRPNYSTAIIAQLQKRLAVNYQGFSYDCVDSGFVTRNIEPSDGTGIASVLFAKDLITYATNSDGSGVANLTDTDLTAIYDCNASLVNSAYSGPVTWKEVGGTSTDWIVPVLPFSYQDTVSDTASAWLADIGVSTPGSCVYNGMYQGSEIQQNEGTDPVFTEAGDPLGYKDILFPFSAADYVCQAYTSRCQNQAGDLMLGNIDEFAPLTGSHVVNINTPNPFPARYIHGEYAVVLNAGTASAPRVPVVPVGMTEFFGQDNRAGWLCGEQSTSDIENYGFAPALSTCGTLAGE